MISVIKPYQSIILAALSMGAAFVIFFETNLISAIPRFRCEGFGCIGLGIIYMALGTILPIILATIMAFVRKTDRRRHFLIALIAGYLSMGAATAVIMSLNQKRIHDGFEKQEEACREYPQFCPEKQNGT